MEAILGNKIKIKSVFEITFFYCFLNDHSTVQFGITSIDRILDISYISHN
jgi:hypothetical protein